LQRISSLKRDTIAFSFLKSYVMISSLNVKRSFSMKLIDAHLHLFPREAQIDALAQRVGHENSTEHLRRVYEELGVVHGVVMGNRSLEVNDHNYPKDLFHYCIGLDSFVTREGLPEDYVEKTEENLKRESCCGVKLYPGYSRVWLSDQMYHPIYALAARYDKPVAVHTGLTNGSRAQLKYSHPLVLDEVAADHRKTRFVMCHFGNPFLDAAAAVLEKNQNVSADLSGLLEGRVDLEEYFLERRGYVELLRTWLQYVGAWDRIMFGTDWPIVNLAEYRDYIARIIPRQHHEALFFDNANHIYGLGL